MEYELFVQSTTLNYITVQTALVSDSLGHHISFSASTVVNPHYDNNFSMAHMVCTVIYPPSRLYIRGQHAPISEFPYAHLIWLMLNLMEE